MKTLFFAIGKIFVVLNPFPKGEQDKYLGRREGDTQWTKGSSIRDTMNNFNHD